MIRDREVISLNDNEYTVVATAYFEDSNYAYIINNDNYNDVLFVKSKSNEVEIITEKQTLCELIPIFNKKLSQN